MRFVRLLASTFACALLALLVLAGALIAGGLLALWLVTWFPGVG